MSHALGRPRVLRGRLAGLIAGALLFAAFQPPAQANPYQPIDDAVVLAELPAGTRYADLSARRLAQGRVDVAVPLAQFYIQQSRLTGDLRYLGYADVVLLPWLDGRSVDPAALILHATVQQSRHEFGAALTTLDRALGMRPNDPQALLTRATILRVLGRYREAGTACEQFGHRVDPRLAALCLQSLRALNGHLDTAYAALTQMSTQGWLNSERSWLYSELGEMAVRLGQDADAQRWFEQDLSLVPTDYYVRAALADLLLRQGRASETLTLLQGQDSFEPLLLRIAIAQKQLHDPRLAQSSARLEAAFAAEMQRGEAVHRREQARYLLEVRQQPQLALAVASENWAVQREPDDVLVFVSAARAAGNPGAAAPALDFVRSQGLRDVRLAFTPTAAVATR
jgi:tetratricopeptide (TPR) repeat protein